MANLVYNNIKQMIVQNQIDFENDTIKIILVNNYYPDVDTEEYFNDVSAYEIVASGYTAGGNELSGSAFVRDDLNDRVKLTATDVNWATVIIVATDGAILYKDTGVLSASPLIAYVDFLNTKSVNGTDFTIEWSDESGILYLT